MLEGGAYDSLALQATTLSPEADRNRADFVGSTAKAMLLT